MSSLQGCCTLCSVLMLVGGTLALVVKVHQDSINATVGQSMLLPVSYRFSSAPRFPVLIRWKFSNSRDTLIICTIHNCSLDAGGTPSSCSETCFPRPTYRGRAELFPQNASLLLRDLQLSDSGVYTVAFILPHKTGNITLTVHEQRGTGTEVAEEGGGTATRIPCYIFGGCYCFILLLLQLLCHLPWCRANS